MGSRTIDRVLEHSAARGAELAILLLIAHKADDGTGTASLTWDEIAGLAKTSRNHLRAFFQRLEERGEVAVERAQRNKPVAIQVLPNALKGTNTYPSVAEAPEKPGVKGTDSYCSGQKAPPAEPLNSTDLYRSEDEGYKSVPLEKELKGTNLYPSGLEGYENVPLKGTDSYPSSDHDVHDDNDACMHEDDLFQLLTANGVDEPVARQLVAKYPDRIQDQVRWLPLRPVKSSKGGYLKSAIENNYKPPKNPIPPPRPSTSDQAPPPAMQRTAPPPVSREPGREAPRATPFHAPDYGTGTTLDPEMQRTFQQSIDRAAQIEQRFNNLPEAEREAILHRVHRAAPLIARRFQNCGQPDPTSPTYVEYWLAVAKAINSAE